MKYKAPLIVSFVLSFSLMFSNVSLAAGTVSVGQWSKMAVMTIGTLDYLHYNSEVERAKPYFTDQAWEQVTGLLDQYHVKTLLVTQSATVATHVYTNPTIDQQWQVPGSEFYEMKVKANVYYHTAFANMNLPLNIDMTVVKVTSNQYKISAISIHAL